MTVQRSSLGKDEMRVPAPPSAPVEQPAEALGRLGEALKARAADVLKATMARTSGSGRDVDALVQNSFERINTSSTIAVARWMTGEGLEVELSSGRISW